MTNGNLREPILSYLQTLLQSMSGIVHCARDAGQLQDNQRPGVLLLDGSEELVSEIVSLKTVKMPPGIFRLRPHIILIAKQRDTPANLTVGGAPAPIGPELSHWLDLIQATLMNDPGLIHLLTTNGQIVYRGHETDMAWGSSMIGAIQIHFDFYYPFFPPNP